MKINIEDFRRFICNELRKKLGENYEVEEHDAVKLNNIGSKGIRIQKDETRICPVIYMEGLYEQYESDEITLEEATICAHMMYQNAKTDSEIKQEITWMEDWNTAKCFVRAKLINTERNTELLNQIPHKNICNLSVTFYLAVETQESISVGITISYELMEMYGQTVDTLYGQAMNNIGRNDIRFMGMKEIVDKVKDEDVSYDEEKINEMEMYILTNRDSMFGASIILTPCAQELIRETFECALYVLPSSVHETILIPRKSNFTPQGLQSMVKEVNSTVLCPMEYLADNVYLLEEDGELKIIA